MERRENEMRFELSFFLLGDDTCVYVNPFYVASLEEAVEQSTKVRTIDGREYIVTKEIHQVATELSAKAWESTNDPLR
jgi:hypothetical protein